MDIFVGRLQHPGHQDYEFLKADLSIFIGIQLLEYLVNGRLIFGVLGEKKAGVVSSTFLQASHPSELSSGQPGKSNS